MQVDEWVGKKVWEGVRRYGGLGWGGEGRERAPRMGRRERGPRMGRRERGPKNRLSLLMGIFYSGGAK